MLHIEEETAIFLTKFLQDIDKISLKKFTYKLPQKGKKRRKLQRLLYGVINNFYLIDWLLNHIELPKSNHELNLLRVITYRIAIEKNMEVLNRIDRVCKYELSKLKTLFENLLASIDKMNIVDKLALRYSFPKWVIEKLLKWVPTKELESMLAGLNQRTYQWAVVNSLKVEPDEVIESLEREGYKTSQDSDFYDVICIKHLPKPLEKSSAYKNQWILLADKSSVSAIHALDPRPGDIILDVCSAPGIKLICSVFRMREGEIIAVDISEDRVRRMKKLLKMYEIEKYVDVKIIVKDARKLSLNDVNACNKILLDPECTSSGIIPRTPDVKLRLTPEKLELLSKLQRELLFKAIEIGNKVNADYIVYSVCSIFPEEAELLIEEISKRFNLKISNLQFGVEAYIPKTGRRFFPHIHKTLGFFVSKILL